MRINKNGVAVPTNNIEKAAIAAKLEAADPYGEIRMDKNWRLHVFAAAIELFCFGSKFNGKEVNFLISEKSLIWVDYIDPEDEGMWQEQPVATPSNAAYIIAAYLLEGKEVKSIQNTLNEANKKIDWLKLCVDLTRPASFTITRDGEEIFRC